MPNIFDAASTLKAVHDTLDEAQAAIPPGKNNAVLIDGTYSTAEGAGLRGLWIHRTESGWSTIFEGSVDRAHGIAGKVAAAKYW